MALQTKLVQKLSQSLLMTPQLQQAIKLLQLGRLEYIEAIQQELLENPVLEEVKEEDPDAPVPIEETTIVESEEVLGAAETTTNPENQESPVDWERYLENITDHSGVSSPKGSGDSEERPSVEATLTRPMTLREHLISQLRMSEIADEDRSIIIAV